MEKQLINTSVGQAVGESVGQVLFTTIRIHGVDLPCLSIAQVARHLHFTKRNVYILINMGKLITIKGDDKLYIPMRSVELYKKGERQPIYDSLESALNLA